MKDYESEHIERTKLYIGCLPCLCSDWLNMHADYHHAEAGRKRQEHTHGFGMCLWHHRGEADGIHDLVTMQRLYGPSFQRTKKFFIETYGTERLLVELNNFALSLWHMQPWLEHCMSVEIASAIRTQHRKMLHDG